MYRFYLAIRFLLSRPINLLGMIGVMLGVWSLIVVVSIFSGFLLEVRKHLSSSAADLSATRLPEDASFAELAEIIESDPNVESCAPRLVWQGLLHPFGKIEAGAPPIGASEIGAETPMVSVIGIDPRLEEGVTGFSGWLRNLPEPELSCADLERPLAELDGRPALIISRNRMLNGDVLPGARAVLTTPRMVYDRGREILDHRELEFTIAGAFESSYSFFDSLNVFVHVDSMRALIGREATDYVNEISIKLRDTGTAEDTARRLKIALNTALPREREPIRVRTWERANMPQLSSVEHQRSLMKLVLFVIMVVAAFLMYATLSMMVTEKTYDIGILTAMGANPRGVMSVFLSCGLAIVLVGTALGLAAGSLTSIYLDDFNQWLRSTFDIDLFPMRIYNLKHVPYDLDPLWMLQVCGMALGVGVLVAGLPAWRAARHDPLRSLRNE